MESRDLLVAVFDALAFAADKHRDQRRKDHVASPYINHPIEVARLLVDVGGVTDVDVVRAAILHDTVEDTDTTPEELEARFGARVAELVMHVTDDKTLAKQERKRLQVEHAPHLPPEAQCIKLADKLSNVRDVLANPPADWSDARRAEYVKWAKDVVDGVRGANPALEAAFDQAIEVGDLDRKPSR